MIAEENVDQIPIIYEYSNERIQIEFSNLQILYRVLILLKITRFFLQEN